MHRAVPEVDVVARPRQVARPLCERAKRGLEPGFFEHVRMEVEHCVAQLPHSASSARARAGRRPLVDFFEYVSYGEEVLEGMIVKRIRECLAFTLLRFERVAQQLRTASAAAAARRAPSSGASRIERRMMPPLSRRGTRLGDNEANRLWLVRGGGERPPGSSRQPS